MTIALSELDAVLQDVLEQELDLPPKELADLKIALLDRLQVEFDVVDDLDEDEDEEVEEIYGD